MADIIGSDGELEDIKVSSMDQQNLSLKLIYTNHHTIIVIVLQFQNQVQHKITNETYSRFQYVKLIAA
jgi:hypothetical protein